MALNCLNVQEVLDSLRMLLEVGKAQLYPVDNDLEPSLRELRDSNVCNWKK